MPLTLILELGLCTFELASLTHQSQQSVGCTLTLSCVQVSTTLQEFITAPNDTASLQNLNISCANNNPQAFLDYMLASFTADGMHPSASMTGHCIGL